MTPEQAQYYLLMLRMGEYDEYDRALDQLLLDHPADEAQLMESQLAYVRKKYIEKAMTAAQVADYLYGLIVANNWDEPWIDLWQYYDVYELYDDGIISQAVFEQCFEAALLRGEDLDCFALQEEENKQKSLLDKVRSALKKS